MLILKNVIFTVLVPGTFGVLVPRWIASCFHIGHITVKDPIPWKIYTEGVATTLKPFGAEIIFRGKRATVLCGKHSYPNAVVIKFPDHPTLQQWYDSKGDQELISIREKAADVLLISYDA